MVSQGLLNRNLWVSERGYYLVRIWASNPKSCKVYPGLGILQLADCCPSISLKKCFVQ